MSCNPPLKVLHLASGDRWAGAEVQLYTLLTQLRKMPDVEPIAVLLNEGELAKRLRGEQITVEILDESKLSSLAIFTGLIKLLRQYQPDVLHTHRQKENILGTLANLISIRARSVRTVHGANENEPQSLQQKVIQALDRWTGNHLQQRIIAVSADLAEKLRDLFDPKRIVVIENGVDIDAVRAAVKPVDFRIAEPDAVHIGIVGRLDPVKRVDIFLEMAQLLIREQPQTSWRFHVFGEGALEQQLKALANTLNITNKVFFHGHRSDIASCIAGLDTLVMCSDHEGLPMTVLETMAVGTPMVAHAMGGLNTVLAENAGGLLVAEHTAQSYANARTQLFQQDLSRFKAAGLARLRERYSAEINSARVAELYRSQRRPSEKALEKNGGAVG